MPRHEWIITLLVPAKRHADRKRRLEDAEDFDDLMELRELDDQGRVPGAVVCTVDEALGYVRDLERSNRGK